MKRSMLSFALVAALASNLVAQGPPGGHGGQPGPGQHPDPFSHFLFPPDLIMHHQSELNLQESQRTTLQSAMQQAHSKFMDVQWKLSSEGEKLGKLLQNASVDEAQVLEQVDRILSLEREMKRTQMSLMVRIKNTLTPAQQAKLRELRDARQGRKEGEQ